ncbi:MAG: RNA methyltransferase [Deltaproteobacteria bacterium]|nr:MAG: RNA methyltransferase [Deltaproteobacteria bacterium]
MKKKVNFDNISIILKQPRCSENIGAAARAIRNMGIGRLVLVNPTNYDIAKVMKLATHAAAEVVEQIELYEELKEALSPYSYVVGTTARIGKYRRSVKNPSKLAQSLIAISRDNNIAIIFGPEDRGLSNEDIKFCDALVNIPTADFSSINLAQAAMIVCYEIFNAGCTESHNFVPRLATRHEIEGMYDQLKHILVRISYINNENPDYWMNKLRHFFTRLHMQAREVSIIRGICRQIDWYGKKCFNDGQKSLSCQQNPLERRKIL